MPWVEPNGVNGLIAINDHHVAVEVDVDVILHVVLGEGAVGSGVYFGELGLEVSVDGVDFVLRLQVETDHEPVVLGLHHAHFCAPFFKVDIFQEQFFGDFEISHSGVDHFGDDGVLDAHVGQFDSLDFFPV